MNLRHLAVLAGLSLASLPAYAASCDLTIEGNDAMQFNLREITVPKTCKQFAVTLKHVGKLPKVAMGHNWVLSKAADAVAVAGEGIPAGIDNSYIKAGDPRVLAFTKVIGGGESTSVNVDVSKLNAGETYSYFCSFPGHSNIMKGTLRLGS